MTDDQLGATSLYWFLYAAYATGALVLLVVISVNGPGSYLLALVLSLGAAAVGSVASRRWKVVPR